MEESHCVECNSLLFEPPGVPRTPCPACGNLARRFDVAIEERVTFHDGTRIKAYRAGSSKFYVDMRDGPSYYRKGEQWHHLVRIIDRENDRYVETIRALGTNELISHVDEPLSQHIGHGGRKNQGGSGEP